MYDQRLIRGWSGHFQVRRGESERHSKLVTRYIRCKGKRTKMGENAHQSSLNEGRLCDCVIT